MAAALALGVAAAPFELYTTYTVNTGEIGFGTDGQWLNISTIPGGAFRLAVSDYDDVPFTSLGTATTRFFTHPRVPLWVSPNGFVTFSPQPMCGYFCDTPASGYYKGNSQSAEGGADWPLIGLYVEDLDPSICTDAGCGVYAAVSDEVAAVEWRAVPLACWFPPCAPTTTLSAQLVMHRNGTLLMRWASAPPYNLSQGVPFAGVVASRTQRVAVLDGVPEVGAYARFDPELDSCAAAAATPLACAVLPDCVWCASLASCVDGALVGDLCAGGVGAAPWYTAEVGMAAPDAFPPGWVDLPSLPGAVLVEASTALADRGTPRAWTHLLPGTLNGFVQAWFSSNPAATAPQWRLVDGLWAGASGAVVPHFRSDGGDAVADPFGCDVPRLGVDCYVPHAVAPWNAPQACVTAESTLGDGRCLWVYSRPGADGGVVLQWDSVVAGDIGQDAYADAAWSYQVELKEDGTAAFRYRAAVHAKGGTGLGPHPPMMAYTPAENLRSQRRWGSGLFDMAGVGANVTLPTPLMRDGLTVTFTPAAGAACIDDCTAASRGWCNRTAGACVCAAGATGAQCQECKAGYFGPQCEQCPSCSGHGTCDAATGACVCTPPYSGVDCNITCPDAPCTPACYHQASPSGGGFCQCGACVCLPGWKGATCSELEADCTLPPDGGGDGGGNRGEFACSACLAPPTPMGCVFCGGLEQCMVAAIAINGGCPADIISNSSLCPAQPQPPPPPSPPGGGSGSGAIAAAVLMSLIGTLLLVGAVAYLLRRRRGAGAAEWSSLLPRSRPESPFDARGPAAALGDQTL